MALITCFNRTYIELKYNLNVLRYCIVGSFNRTYIELKLPFLNRRRIALVRFNRTYIELKCGNVTTPAYWLGVLIVLI